MYTTRFNPSANGGLHLGHAYMALINEALAHESGGRFVVRWDDVAPAYDHIGDARKAVIRAGQRAELEWLGIQVDEWIPESRIIEQVNAELAKLGIETPPDPVADRTPRLLIEGRPVLYPCTPTLTAQKVIMDYWSGVNLLVRGIDLVTEFGLYEYFRQRFDLPEIEHVYLPRLMGPRGDISKTTGGHTLAELRADGWTPGQVRDRIGMACLCWYKNGWHLDNLRAEPRL